MADYKQKDLLEKIEKALATIKLIAEVAMFYDGKLCKLVNLEMLGTELVDLGEYFKRYDK